MADNWYRQRRRQIAAVHAKRLTEQFYQIASKADLVETDRGNRQPLNLLLQAQLHFSPPVHAIQQLLVLRFFRDIYLGG